MPLDDDWSYARRGCMAATSEILRVISSSPTDVQPVFDSLVASAARLCGANDLILLIREADMLRPAAGVGSLWQNLTPDFRVPLVRGTVAARSVRNLYSPTS
jgi:hypothetical protein